MKTRDQLRKEIKTSKKAKGLALAGFIISVCAYFYFDKKQVKAEKELFILDQGRLDEMVLAP